MLNFSTRTTARIAVIFLITALGLDTVPRAAASRPATPDAAASKPNIVLEAGVA